MTSTVAVLYGSHRSDREGVRAVRFVEKSLRARGHSVEVLDACKLDLPILDRMYKEYEAGQAPDALEHMAKVLEKARGFVVVTGEYNHAPPPGLKNMLDHFLQHWFWRPSAIVSYSAGSFGGVRAAIQLRIVVGELGMPSISSMLPIPKVEQFLSEDGQDTSGRLDDSFDRFYREFQWYMDALAAQREKGTPF